MDFAGTNQPRQASRSKKLLLFVFTAVLLILFSALLDSSKKAKDQQDTLAAVTTPEPKPASPTPSPENTNNGDNRGLETAVEGALQGSKGKYGIVVKNLKTGLEYRRDDHEVFEPGSLYKLWVMAVVYKNIENGKLTKDQVLNDSVENLNKKFQISSESAGLSTGMIRQTVDESLTKMITISDNYSALLLTSKIRLSSVSDFLKANGFNESKVTTNGDHPSTTASDIELFFEKLYKGQLGNEESTEEMISLLKKQRLNDKLPKYLPDSLVMAHKTGEIDWYTHDAGIVYSSAGDYIIAALSESNYPPGAEERIGGVSKRVYDFFSGTADRLR